MQNTTINSYGMIRNPYLDYLYQGQYEYELLNNIKNNANQHIGDYKALAAKPLAQHDAFLDTVRDHAYHVPAYFDRSEAPKNTHEHAREEVKLEFDPPLSHYAELRGGLPIGYVWIPPSSPEPEPMPRKATPEQDVVPVTPSRPVRTVTTIKKPKRKKTVIFAFSPLQKKRKRETTAEYHMRFTSPLSEELSDAPSGLLTPEPRELVLHRR